MAKGRDASGFVLVGGRSSRMGVDKASMPFRGEPLARHVAAQLAPVVDDIAFIGDPARHAGLGLPLTPDQYPGAGPVGAVLTALHSTESTWKLVCACDLPGVRTESFRELFRRTETTRVQVVIPVTPDGRAQVLCAAYRKDCEASLVTAFEAGERSLRLAVRRADLAFWDVDAAGWLVNVNTPEEFAGFQTNRENLSGTMGA